MKSIVVAATILLAGLAQAQTPAPENIGYEGRLLKASGLPETAAVNLTFTLFDAASAGNSVWTETHTNVQPVDGFYSLFLGSKTAFPSAAFDGGDRFLEISVNGSPLSPRQHVGFVPYAMRATNAVNLSGGTVNATSIKVNNATIIDSTGKLAGTAVSVATGGGLALNPANALTLLTSGCTSGQVLKFDGASWACANDNTGTAGTTYTAGAGVAISGTNQISVMACSAANQLLTWNGTTWTCAAPATNSAAYIQNNATATAQAASFNISGAATIGQGVSVGGAAKDAQLGVKGAPGFTGTGTVSTTSNTTLTVNGAVTSFQTEVNPGDVLVISGQRRIVTAVSNNTTLTVDRAYNPQIVGGTGFTVERPVARFTLPTGNAGPTVNANGDVVADEARIGGYYRRDDIRIMRYHAACQALAGNTYANVAAVSPGRAANLLTGAARLTGTQVCANYVGNNNITGWTCLSAPYVYEYSRNPNGYLGTDVRPTWNPCSSQFPDNVGSYHWFEPNDPNTVMMACCVHN